MSEDEAIDILQNCIADYVIGEYCEKCGDRLVCADKNEDCYFQQAIDTILDLYKQEKERNKKLDRENQALYESINLNDDNMLARLYREEKEKNKELEEKCKEVVCIPEGTCFMLKPKNTISKDKIKEILEKHQKTPIDEGYKFYKDIQKLLEEE